MIHPQTEDRYHSIRKQKNIKLNGKMREKFRPPCTKYDIFHMLAQGTSAHILQVQLQIWALNEPNRVPDKDEVSKITTILT